MGRKAGTILSMFFLMVFFMMSATNAEEGIETLYAGYGNGAEGFRTLPLEAEADGETAEEAYRKILLKHQTAITEFEKIQESNRYEDTGGLQSVLLYDFDKDGSDELILFRTVEENDAFHPEWVDAVVYMYTYRDGAASNIFVYSIRLQGGDSSYTNVDLADGFPYLYFYASELGHTEEMYRLQMHENNPVTAQIAARFSRWYPEGEDEPDAEEFLAEGIPVTDTESQAVIDAYLARRTVLLSTDRDTGYGRTLTDALRELNNTGNAGGTGRPAENGENHSPSGTEGKGEGTTGVQARTNKKKVNVRAGADISSELVDKLIPAETVILLVCRAYDAEGTLWYGVRLPDGREGFIRADLLTPMETGAERLPMLNERNREP